MANQSFLFLGKRISLLLGGLLIALAIMLPASSVGTIRTSACPPR